MECGSRDSTATLYSVELGGTGILMQGGVHPDLKIDYYERLLAGIKQRFQIHCHCFSPPEILNIARVSKLSVAEVFLRLKRSGLDSMPGGGGEILSAPPRRGRRAALDARLRDRGCYRSGSLARRHPRQAHPAGM